MSFKKTKRKSFFLKNFDKLQVIRALVAVQVAMHPCEGKERFNVNVYEELYSEMLQPTVSEAPSSGNRSAECSD